METVNVSYQLFAQGFVVILNGTVVLILGMNWIISRKPYLAIACLAGLLEITRQVPNAILTLTSSNFLLVVTSITLQFLPSLVLFLALARMNDDQSVAGKWLFRLSALAFTAAFCAMLVGGLPEDRVQWAIYSQPLTLITLGLVWQSWKSHREISAGRVLLIAASLGLLTLRLIGPFVATGELFYLIYYIENLSFPIVLAALAIVEVENVNRTVNNLLEERAQSERDLKFILDSALDVILITDPVGLLKNWTRRAEQVFGYTSQQAVGKIHLDELVADNQWRQKIEEGVDFTSRIEHVEGHAVEVGVRFESISHQGDDYTIFVMRQLSDAVETESLLAQPIEASKIL